MIGMIVKKMFGTRNERELKKLQPLVEKINSLEADISALSDADLKSKTQTFKSKIQQGLKEFEGQGLPAKDLQKEEDRILEEILPEAFAVVREVAKRTVGMRHFDVQLIGGITLHQGKIAEMATGEGKTLVATLPAYLNALSGRGVHIITVNDYLAQRDRNWMGPIFEFLGLRVGVIQHDMPPQQRQYEYGCDITYGTNNEFGFDYLRDNMVIRKENMVQRGHHYSIVDEVDSILIDESRTPLIISGPAEESTDKYYIIDRLVPKLKGKFILDADLIKAKFEGVDLGADCDYLVDEKSHTANLTERGVKRCEELLNIENLYDDIQTEWVSHIEKALRAHNLFKRDTHYVVKDGQVIIVDEFTGRLMPGRRWSDGQHQAVEAKEGLKIERENQTLATITLQNYFKMYSKLSGMTGTAFTEATEFKQIYGLDVTVIPTNKPLARTNHADVIYRTAKEKYNCVVDEIAELNEQGRPVLVGTISIEKSEYLSELLKRKGIKHNVLNAKYHEMEAHIVAQAGRYKAVTIATNMAGRGTDILLGGNAEHMALNLLKDSEVKKEDPAYEQERIKFVEKFRQEVNKEHEDVVKAGGLHVIGTERHEARRVDNQLRGRAGRQGDPGSSKFYVSLEDDLMRLFGSDRIKFLMDRFQWEEGLAIEHPLVSRAIETAQKRVESHNFEIRKTLLEYDNIMNRQREVIYKRRRKILQGEAVKEEILDIIYDLIDERCKSHLFTDANREEGLAAMSIWLKNTFGLMIEDKQLDELNEHDTVAKIYEAVENIYNQKEADLGPEQMRGLERMVSLQVIDSRWKEHLYAMDILREGIGLRAYGQRDPLIEYQHEGFGMFSQMMGRVDEDIVNLIFKVGTVEDKQFRGVFSAIPQRISAPELSTDFAKRAPKKPQQQQQPSQAQMPEEPKGQTVRIPPSEKVGRNEPCPCGSGKKYKKCCGR